MSSHTIIHQLEVYSIISQLFNINHSNLLSRPKPTKQLSMNSWVYVVGYVGKQHITSTCLGPTKHFFNEPLEPTLQLNYVGKKYIGSIGLRPAEQFSMSSVGLHFSLCRQKLAHQAYTIACVGKRVQTGLGPTKQFSVSSLGLYFSLSTET